MRGHVQTKFIEHANNINIVMNLTAEYTDQFTAVGNLPWPEQWHHLLPFSHVSQYPVQAFAE